MEGENEEDKIKVYYSEKGKNIEQVLSEIFRDLYKSRIIKEKFGGK